MHTRRVYGGLLLAFCLAAALCGCDSGVDPNPVAAFTSATELRSDGTLVRLDASDCGDAQDVGDNLVVRWDWENDGEFDTPYTVEKTAEHLYRDAGTYTIILEVRDSTGLSATHQAIVTVTPHLSLTPAQATLSIGERETFSATVVGVANHAVTWTASDGTIAEGVYTAPSIAGTYQITVTSAADSAVSTTAQVRVVSGGVNVEVN